MNLHGNTFNSNASIFDGLFNSGGIIDRNADKLFDFALLRENDVEPGAGTGNENGDEYATENRAGAGSLFPVILLGFAAYYLTR